VALLLLGTYTGSSVDREALVQIRRVLPVALSLILVMIGEAVALGWMLHSRFAGDISLVTVMLGTMPGGASGLSAVAFDMGAEVHLVASMHMVRQIMVFGALPLVLRWLAESGLGKRRGETNVEYSKRVRTGRTAVQRRKAHRPTAVERVRGRRPSRRRRLRSQVGLRCRKGCVVGGLKGCIYDHKHY